MQLAIMSVLFTIALADLFFSREVRFAPVILIFLAAKTQADYAAAKFLKYGLKLPASWFRPEPHFMHDLPAAPPAAEEAPKKPFREAQPQKVISLAEARARRKNKARAEQRAEAKKRKPDPLPFELPKFSGKPSEVLGLKENANTRQINQAFRHWIKRFHPDVAEEQADATERARKLNAAKESLLEKRKQMRKAG